MNAPISRGRGRGSAAPAAPARPPAAETLVRLGMSTALTDEVAGTEELSVYTPLKCRLTQCTCLCDKQTCECPLESAIIRVIVLMLYLNVRLMLLA